MDTNWREISHSAVWPGFELGPVNCNVNAWRLRELCRANYVHHPSMAMYPRSDYSHLFENYSRSVAQIKFCVLKNTISVFFNTVSEKETRLNMVSVLPLSRTVLLVSKSTLQVYEFKPVCLWTHIYYHISSMGACVILPSCILIICCRQLSW